MALVYTFRFYYVVSDFDGFSKTLQV
jgi:hypothetical protein